MELPRHALIKVKAWTEDPRLNIIWIEGTSPFFPRSKDNLPSWKPYQNTTSSPPRYIFASCNPKSTSSTDSQLHERRSNEELALLCLLDSIIAQLQEIFPSLYLDRPESIDRSNESADVALRIIQAFLEEDKVPSLVWVIDGLQFTESASTNPFLIKLVKSLRFRGYKICLTTQGTSRVLSQVTWDYEQVKASNSMWKNGGYTWMYSALAAFNGLCACWVFTTQFLNVILMICESLWCKILRQEPSQTERWKLIRILITHINSLNCYFLLKVKPVKVNAWLPRTHAFSSRSPIRSDRARVE